MIDWSKRLKPKRRVNRTLIIFLFVAVFFIALISISSKIKNLNEKTLINVSVNQPEQTETTNKKIVCLDPGHGGKDAGAVYKNLTESALNLKVSLQAQVLLEKAGYVVFMTRTDDSFLYKRPRARECNDNNGSILVAIHHNSYETDTSVDYSTALYYKDSDQALAANILDAVSAELKTRNQGIAKFDDSELYIATMPATLIEGLFITNKSEYENITLNNSDRIRAEAEGIVTGIENYFTNPTKPSDTTTSDSLILDRSDYGD